MRNTLTVLAGALLLLWPALLNAYPIVYSDTGGFLEQALMPDIGWDKPWIYGPFLTPFHLRLTLWPAAAAQVLILSALLWLTQSVLRPPGRLAHLAVCALLAAGTAAPWFASTLMPDIFAPITVLGTFLLASRRLSRPATALVALVTILAIATHLAHLVLAAACLLALSLLQWRILWRQAGTLVAALTLVVAGNLVGNGVLAVSPYGSVFALARLVANGPARLTIAENCPASGWRLCTWKDTLPTDSDDFLWDPHGPVWADAYGPVRIAPEAAAIVRATLRAHPGAVIAAATHDTLAQLPMAALGDTLGPDHLDVAVRTRLLAYFPPTEVARFDAGLQARGLLRAWARPLNPPHAVLLVLGAVTTLAVALVVWRRHRLLATLAMLVLVAVGANAVSTGALSHPHHRYGARIAWLLVLVPALAATVRLSLRPAPPPPAASGSSAG